MTYLDLANKINKMNPQEQMQDVTVYLKNTDEYFAATSLKAVVGELNDILDEGHNILIIDA